MYKKIISYLLLLAMAVSVAMPVSAEETEMKPAEVTTAVELKISTVEEFLQFAQACRLDRYSRNLVATLEKDLDLTGVRFESIPIFCGTFDGNGYRISGLSITQNGSVQGLFRYLTETAIVQNLTLEGQIEPNGSHDMVGAIAGENKGQIKNCTFVGTVSGGDYVGGLAGINTMTGLIENCRLEGQLHGDHFVGGVAGENSGVIRKCVNKAAVNVTPQQNSVEITDITLETLTNTEAVNTVTDIGGIAGISSGVIRNCENRGDVGYQHMGYNIGGIAGTQSGYIYGCENYGFVRGRKEVGGIVGQLEPAALIEYTEDVFQILQGQLDTMSGLVNKASSNAQHNAGSIGGHIGSLQEQTQTARDAVDVLFSGSGIPDADEIVAAQNALSTSLGAMPGTMRSIAAASQATVNGLSRDLTAVSDQIGAMSETISRASENVGASVIDVSDEDTAETLSAKVEKCVNYGDVLADLNVGGISGAIAMENDADILEDLSTIGDSSVNFETEVRAVVLKCENQGAVTGSKQNVGGITGWQSLGLIRGSLNLGKIDAENADYAGGVSGRSTGFIRASFAKCDLRASTYVGGIAGSATIVTDSVSLVRIENGKEKMGAILGEVTESKTQDEENPVFGNYYPLFGQDIGAIDGVSYDGLAQPIAVEEFLLLKNLPSQMRTVKVRFFFKNGALRETTVPLGEEFPENQIPYIPSKAGYNTYWDGLENLDLAHLVTDVSFRAVYERCSPVIQSAQVGKDGRPVVLAEGVFYDDAILTAERTDAAPAGASVLESWTVQVSEGAETLRLLLPDGVSREDVKLLSCDAQGYWHEVNTIRDGSYLVFEAEQETMNLALTVQENNNMVMIAAVVMIVAVISLAVIFLKMKGAKKK